MALTASSLRCEGECSCLVSVDGVGEVIEVEESLVGFGDRYLVEGRALAFNLYPSFFVLDDFF